MKSLLVVGSIVAAAHSWAIAQCSPGWLPGNELPGIDGKIAAATEWDPDGDGPQPPVLVVGGEFSLAGGKAASNIAIWDGVAWHALGDGRPERVLTLAVYRGELIAGIYQHAGTVNTARWDGSAWQPMGTSSLSATHLLADGDDLFCVFYSGTSQFTAWVMRWDGATWQTLGASFTTPGSLIRYHGDLICGAGGLKRWDGSSWQLFAGTLTINIRAMAVYNDELVLAGQSNESTGNIIRWDGSTWQPVGSVTRASTYSLLVKEGALYAGEAYDSDGYRGVQRWDGESWSHLAGLEGAPANVLASLGPDLIAAGQFTSGGNPTTKMRGVARWNGSGWHALNEGMNSYVRALGEFNGRLVVGGDFTPAGTFLGNHIAEWDGASWRPLGGGINEGPVTALVEFQGRLIAGWQYVALSDRYKARFGAWDGTAWEPFESTNGGTVYALGVYHGELIAAGFFTSIGAVPLAGIGRWDGSAWRPLGSGLGGGTVYALAVYHDELVAAGTFTSAGSAPASRIARWDGSVWRTLGADITAYPSGVRSLCVYDDDLVVGGGFDLTAAGGVNAVNLARWNGTAWSGFGSSFTGTVLSLCVHQGDLVVGGDFTKCVGISANGLARFNGTAWKPFAATAGNLGGGLNNYVYALSSLHGELFAGGTFTPIPYTGAPGYYLARWSDTGAPWIAAQPLDVSPACPGITATFEAVPASGFDTLTFRWQRESAPGIFADLADGATPWGSSVSGAATPALAIADARAEDTGRYRCIISDGCGSIASDSAALTICLADFDCDGFVNGVDFDTFLDEFSWGTAAADINRDGFTNGVDFDGYVDAFVLGC